MNITGEGGKGSARRKGANDQAYKDNYDAIFKSTSVNQCDGCNAGMYKDVQGMHRDEDSNPVMVCQASRY